MKYLQSFDVNYKFNVATTTKVFGQTNDTLKSVMPDISAKCYICLEKIITNTQEHIVEDIKVYLKVHYKNLKLIPEFFIHPGGEEIKNQPKFVYNIIDKMLEHKICRHSYVLIIGGGAFLDAVGYACSIFHRGIRHIRFPTTVLAQTDGGLGVKNAINYAGKKNCLGTFNPPNAILNDFSFIQTLPKRDIIAGISEIIKVTLIKDEVTFKFIEQNSQRIANLDWGIINNIIVQSAVFHLDHIGKGGDPFERGSSRPLDFGHWSAHRLEHISNYHIRHGDAVAIGVALDSYISFLMGLLAEKSMWRIINCLKAIGFQIFNENMLRTNENGELLLISGLSEFQEHLGGKLTVLMLKEIGTGLDIHHLDEQHIKQGIDFLQEIS